MELSVNGRQRRAAELTKTSGAQKKTAPAAGKAAAPKSRADKLSWSQQALAFLQEVNRQDAEKQRKLLEARQKGKGEQDLLGKALRVMDKCREIAARIIKGDKVPPQDERYLMENDPDGYKLALACRQPKEKPKEWESVLDEEDLEGGTSGGGGTAEPSESADSGGEAAEC